MNYLPKILMPLFFVYVFIHFIQLMPEEKSQEKIGKNSGE